MPEKIIQQVEPKTSIVEKSASVTPPALPIVKEDDTPFGTPKPPSVCDDNDIARMHEEAMRADGVPYCSICNKRILVDLNNQQVCQEIGKTNCPISQKNLKKSALLAVEQAGIKIELFTDRIIKAQSVLDVAQAAVKNAEVALVAYEESLSSAEKEAIAAEKALAQLQK
jgi:hypothetical protein